MGLYEPRVGAKVLAETLIKQEVFAMQVSRRQFLKITAGTVAVAALADRALALTALQPVVEVGNPLGEYPDRSWE
jgi:TAT (twin-arginine translocation) pathway signal sequence